MIKIIPATMRDVSWIAAHMTKADHAEIMCQFPPHIPPSGAGAMCFEVTPEEFCWVATLNGEPVAAFGLMNFTYPVWMGWSFGTAKQRRAIPAMTRHFLAQAPRLIDLGCRRIEVRAMRSHEKSSKWIISMGAKHVCEIPDCGQNGETFDLWAWNYTDHVFSKSIESSSSSSGSS
jgi:hypothetical protein